MQAVPNTREIPSPALYVLVAEQNWVMVHSGEHPREQTVPILHKPAQSDAAAGTRFGERSLGMSTSARNSPGNSALADAAPMADGLGDPKDYWGAERARVNRTATAPAAPVRTVAASLESTFLNQAGLSVGAARSARWWRLSFQSKSPSYAELWVQGGWLNFFPQFAPNDPVRG